MELAIDTSTETASLALSLKGKVQAELTWHAGRNHTKELLPNLIHLLHQASLQDIEGIIVARGPGSFNGLRVGMATAKGLGLALSIPLVSISTLEMEAFQHAATGQPICPIFNAGRGEIATALFQTKQGKWQRLIEEHITTIEELCAKLTARTIFCGQISPEIASQLKEWLGEQVVIVEGASSLRRAGYLAELGWRRLEKGDHDDPATLQPLYLRRPAITLK